MIYLIAFLVFYHLFIFIVLLFLYLFIYLFFYFLGGILKRCFLSFFFIIIVFSYFYFIFLYLFLFIFLFMFLFIYFLLAVSFMYYLFILFKMILFYLFMSLWAFLSARDLDRTEIMMYFFLFPYIYIYIYNVCVNDVCACVFSLLQHYWVRSPGIVGHQAKWIPSVLQLDSKGWWEWRVWWLHAWEQHTNMTNSLWAHPEQVKSSLIV